MVVLHPEKGASHFFFLLLSKKSKRIALYIKGKETPILEDELDTVFNVSKWENAILGYLNPTEK
jgi:hypothetical protein